MIKKQSSRQLHTIREKIENHGSYKFKKGSFYLYVRKSQRARWNLNTEIWFLKTKRG